MRRDLPNVTRWSSSGWQGVPKNPWEKPEIAIGLPARKSWLNKQGAFKSWLMKRRMFKNQLDSIPKNHPDRSFIKKQYNEFLKDTLINPKKTSLKSEDLSNVILAKRHEIDELRSYDRFGKYVGSKGKSYNLPGFKKKGGHISSHITPEVVQGEDYIRRLNKLYGTGEGIAKMRRGSGDWNIPKISRKKMYNKMLKGEEF